MTVISKRQTASMQATRWGPEIDTVVGAETSARVEGDRVRRCATGTAERRDLTRTTPRDRRTRHVRKGCPGTWAAARLVTIPAGESPAGGGCPATTVVIPGGGEGDRPAGSPGVNVSGSDREASNLAGCSGSETGSPEIWAPRDRIVGGSRECRALLRWVKAAVVNGIAGRNNVDKLSGVLEDDMPRRNRERKPGTTRGSLRRSRTAKAARINRDPVKSRCACEWDGWGRLSADGAGQNNPNPSEDPWGGATRVARTAVCDWIQTPDSDQTELGITKHTKGEDKPSGETSMPGAGLIRTSFREGLV